MSITTATRTGRFAPPAVPTAKVVRRPADRRGSARIGADRPVLRIVASPSEPCPTPVRAVDLETFFASEYDGDDVRLEVVRSRPSTVRLTRRGRSVVLVAGLLASLTLGFVAATHAVGDSNPEQTHEITVQPGQTLWDISARAAHRAGNGDVGSMMTHLEALNHLDSAGLQIGQHLRVPR